MHSFRHARCGAHIHVRTHAAKCMAALMHGLLNRGGVGTRSSPQQPAVTCVSGSTLLWRQGPQHSKRSNRAFAVTDRVVKSHVRCRARETQCVGVMQSRTLDHSSRTMSMATSQAITVTHDSAAPPASHAAPAARAYSAPSLTPVLPVLPLAVRLVNRTMRAMCVRAQRAVDRVVRARNTQKSS